MRSYLVRWLRGGLFLVVVLATASAVLITLPAQAGSNGTLKLKVRQCYGSSWMSGASVNVTIYRPGVGNVDSDSGITDSAGYVEISFDDLENGDEAHVLVTPAGGPPSSTHTYYWAEPEDQRPGLWDIDTYADDPCVDGWHDVSKNIILCLHA